MCVTVTKYQNLIYSLEGDVYPSFEQLLNSIHIEDKSPLAGFVNFLVSRVKKDFESLETFDRELTFPAALSLFNENNEENEFGRDIPGIISITNIKEEKLKKSIDQIATILKINEDLLTLNDRETITEKLHELTYFFYNHFLPAKQFWNQWLLRLQHSDTQCNNLINQQCKCSEDTNRKKNLGELSILQS